MEMETDTLVHHYQDKLAEPVNTNHPLRQSPLPHRTRQSHSNKLCDSVMVRSKVRIKMQQPHYSNNLLSLLHPVSPVHPEVVELHSHQEEEEEVDIELGFSIRISLGNMLITVKLRLWLKDNIGVNNPCLIPCRLSHIICKCTDGDLCHLLLNLRLLFRG